MHACKSYGLVAVVIFAGLLIGGESEQAHADTASDKASIRKVINSYVRALNNSDLNTVLQLYAKDGVFMPSHKPTATGLTEIEAAYKIVFDTLDFDVVFHIEEILPFGPLAVVRTSSGGHIKLVDKDVAIVNRSREVFILQKHQGSWKIARYLFNESASSND